MCGSSYIASGPAMRAHLIDAEAMLDHLIEMHISSHTDEFAMEMDLAL
jgi:hypothetical protein